MLESLSYSTADASLKKKWGGGGGLRLCSRRSRWHFLRNVFFFYPEVQRGCPPGWDLYQDHCYTVGQNGKDFSEADFGCVKFGQSDMTGPYSDLAEITSEEENNFIKELLRRDADDAETSAWIDLKQNDLGTWVSAHTRYATVVYTDWATPSRPQFTGPKCAVLSRDEDWAWEEKDCDEVTPNRTFVCEKESTQMECSGESCYDLFNERVHGIGEARNICEDFGGYVVEIDTQEELNFVKDFLNRAEVPVRTIYTWPERDVYSDVSVWLGASDEDKEGDFYWKHGDTAVEFSDWANGGPNRAGGRHREKDCSVMDGNNDWKWNDVKCYEESAVLCERPNVNPITG